MKNVRILLLGLAFVALSVQAQQTKFGIRGGAALSSLDFDNSVEFDNDSRVGAYLGGFADLGISDSFSIMVEAQYAAEGAKEKPFRLSLIQLPVQLRYAISPKVTLGAGPQFSFIAWDTQDVFNQYAFSAVGSLEFLITDMFFVDFRYNLGITDVLDNSFMSDNEARNSSVQVGIGIKI